MNRFEFYDRLKDYNSLSHADKYGAPSGTNKYYAKLDDFYGKGKPRYFYSKEEWDGYQKNKGYAENAEKDKANKNNKAIEEKNKKIAAETYRKNEQAAKAGNGDRDRFLSNWEKDKPSYNDTQASSMDTTDNIRYECGVDIDDRKLNETLNNFYNAIDMGSKIGGFDSVGMGNYYNSLWKGDEKSRKGLLSRIQRSIDIYERDIDKFEKQLNDYLNKKYNGEENTIERKHDAVMDKLKEKYEYNKENYKKINEDFNGWRQDKIDDYFGEELINGMTNQESIDKLKSMGTNAYLDYMMKKKGYDNTKLYSEDVIQMIRDAGRRICEKTLENNK